MSTFGKVRDGPFHFKHLKVGRNENIDTLVKDIYEVIDEGTEVHEEDMQFFLILFVEKRLISSVRKIELVIVNLQ